MLIARHVAELHFDANNVNKDTALDENPVNDRTKQPPQHGCSMERIGPTGGDGRLYCFAAN